MLTKEQLRSKVRRLESQAKKLRAEIHDLTNRVALAGRHQRSNTGIKGEKFLLRELGGVALSGNGCHDLTVQGRRIEVKTALCRNVDGTREEITRRWTWHRPFGANGKNAYDYLVLLGAMDSRLRKHYKQPKSTYVIFLLPRKAAHEFWGKTKRKLIQCTTDPRKQRTKLGRQLWTYEKSMVELKRCLGKANT